MRKTSMTFTQAAEERVFTLGDIITVYSGVFVSPKNLVTITNVNDMWQFLTGTIEWDPDAVFRTALHEQCPFLSEIDIDRLKQAWNSDRRQLIDTEEFREALKKPTILRPLNSPVKSSASEPPQPIRKAGYTLNITV